MIKLIENLPDNAIGLQASGKITGDDYENVIIPALEEKFATYDKIRLLYFMGPEYDGFSGEAMWDDTKIGLKHLTHCERVAIVTDIDWIRRSIKVFGFMVPGEVKLFGNDQLEDAKAWISE